MVMDTCPAIEWRHRGWRAMSRPGEELVVPAGPGLPTGLVIPAGELVERFSRSPGPGGQSVNTSDSRVELEYDVSTSTALSDAQRARMLARLGSRWSAAGCSSPPPSTARSTATGWPPANGSPGSFAPLWRPRRHHADPPSRPGVPAAAARGQEAARSDQGPARACGRRLALVADPLRLAQRAFEPVPVEHLDAYRHADPVLDPSARSAGRRAAVAVAGGLDAGPSARPCCPGRVSTQT